MGRFCKTHIVERTKQELLDYKLQLEEKLSKTPSGPQRLKLQGRLSNCIRALGQKK